MTSVTSSYSEHENVEESLLSKIGLLKIAFMMLIIGTVWRITDIFVLQLGNTPMNILPSKLGPLLIIIFVFWKYRKKQFSSVLGLSKEDFPAQSILGIIMGFVVIFSIVFLPPVIFHFLIDSSYPLTINVMHPELLLYLLFFFFVNAVFEEVLFRGLLQNALTTRLKFKYALLLQAFIFGIWHATWPIINGPTSSTFIQESISVVVLSGILGGFFGLYYEKFSHGRTLTGTIIAHTIFNFLNESINIGPSPDVQGPDFSFTEPGIMMIALILFVLTFSSMILLALKYKIEDVQKLGVKLSDFIRRK